MIAEENKKLKEATKAKKGRSRKKPPSNLQLKKLRLGETLLEEESANNEIEVVYAKSDNYDKFNGDKCMVCYEFSNTEDWYQCSSCRIWVHAECTLNI